MPAAVLLHDDKHYRFTTDAALHEHPQRTREDQVVIGVESIGLNPIDWKCNVYGFGVYHFPWISGRECSGVVLEVGSNVDPSRLQVGDRVAVASTNYRDNRTSTYQERCIALAENCIRIPDSVSFEQAAALGVGFVSAYASLYDSMRIPIEPSASVGDKGQRDWILIWGGATVTGLLAGQLARHSGLRVITASSPRNFQILSELGVEETLDRGAPDTVVQRARELGVKYVLDCVGDKTGLFGIEALSRSGSIAGSSGRSSPRRRTSSTGSSTHDDPGAESDNTSYSDTEDPIRVFVPLVKAPKLRKLSEVDGDLLSGGKSDDALVRSFNRTDLERGPDGKPLPPVYDDLAIRLGEVVVKRFHEHPDTVGRRVTSLAERLLASGFLRPPPIRKFGGGLGGINAGLDALQRGEASCEKFVVNVRDTPDYQIPVYPTSSRDRTQAPAPAQGRDFVTEALQDLQVV
ncbi:hypothetical protein PYCC9005_002590 [Savitreella phatthalungensis]